MMFKLGQIEGSGSALFFSLAAIKELLFCKSKGKAKSNVWLTCIPWQPPNSVNKRTTNSVATPTLCKTLITKP